MLPRGPRANRRYATVLAVAAGLLLYTAAPLVDAPAPPRVQEVGPAQWYVLDVHTGRVVSPVPPGGRLVGVDAETGRTVLDVPGQTDGEPTPATGAPAGDW